MESESSSSSWSMRRVPLNGRQPVSKIGVAHEAKGSIPSPSSKSCSGSGDGVRDTRAGL